jgi:phosphoserine phosphatase RsbU/P
MVYSNAGHPPPVVVRASGGIEPLAVTAPALGLPQGVPVREAYVVFAPGDGLVLFTDGVTEVGPSPDEFFDVEGVEATVRQLWACDAAAVCDGLLEAVVQRAGGSLPDDATVVVAKFTS